MKAKGTQPHEKKIPERRCIGCGEHFPKMSLIRVVRSPEGELSIDATGKKAGRGAYLCHSKKCFQKARKSGRLAQNLSCTVPNEILDALEASLCD